MIRRESVRLNALVQDILALSRLERGAEGSFDFAEADLTEIAGESVARFSGPAAAAGVEIETGFAVRCPVRCDAAQVSRAVDNLIANALRHSGSGIVRVSTLTAGAYAVVEVEDHGKGIAPEHREKVFERFHRVDPSRSDRTGGSGLGLAIVRGIAKLHGGEVRLESVKPSGCRFTLRLPASQHPAAKFRFSAPK
jgi:signal transduction histidine kinase